MAGAEGALHSLTLDCGLHFISLSMLHGGADVPVMLRIALVAEARLLTYDDLAAFSFRSLVWVVCSVQLHASFTSGQCTQVQMNERIGMMMFGCVGSFQLDSEAHLADCCGLFII